MANDENITKAPEEKRQRTSRLRGLPQIEITVGEETITTAVQRDSRHCWIAESIALAYPDASSVTVDLQSIRISNRAKRLRYLYLTPPACQRALIDFDRGLKPEPFSFSLKRPAQIVRSGRIAGEKPQTTEEKTENGRNRQTRARNALKLTRAESDDVPFEPPAEYVNKVIAALDDPRAELGTPVPVRMASDSTDATPVFVGGKAPRHPPARGAGNMQRTRLFGLRQLIP